jgi:heat shock protein HslJ
MNNKVKTLHLLLLAVVTVTACKKSNDNTPGGGTSQASLLTTTSWKFSKLEFQNKDGSWYNASPLPSDASSISIAFNAGGGFSEVGGFNPHTGTWKLSDDGNTLTVAQSITYGTPFTNENSTVNTLTSSTLQLTTSNVAIYVNGPTGFPQNYYGERDTFSH